MPGAVAREGAPGAELGRELERRPAGAARDRSRNRGLVAGDREVEVDDRARPSASRTAPPTIHASPAPSPASAPAATSTASAPASASATGVIASRRSSRGTRAEIPQVTS